MEPYDKGAMDSMVSQLIQTIKNGYSIETVIIKTHVNHFVSSKVWDSLSTIYTGVMCVRSQFASALSSEIYVICKDKREGSSSLFISTYFKKFLINQYKSVWSDSKSEFNRMLLLKDQDMGAGIDARLLPNCVMEFEEMLHELGISYKDRCNMSSLLLGSADIHKILSCMKSIKKFGMREHWKVSKDRLSDIIPTSGRVSCT